MITSNLSYIIAVKDITWPGTHTLTIEHVPTDLEKKVEPSSNTSLQQEVSFWTAEESIAVL